MAKPLDILTIDAVTALTTGSNIDTNGHFHINMVVTATGSAVATILLEGSADGTNFYLLATRSVSAAGNASDTVTGAHFIVRARVSAYTSGTLTVRIVMTGNADVGF